MPLWLELGEGDRQSSCRSGLGTSTGYIVVSINKRPSGALSACTASPSVRLGLLSSCSLNPW